MSTTFTPRLGRKPGKAQYEHGAPAVTCAGPPIPAAHHRAPRYTPAPSLFARDRRHKRPRPVLPRTAAKYLWPAQIPLRLGFELVRTSVPPVNCLVTKLGEHLAKSQFPKQVTRTRADTSFSPVGQLSR